MLDKYARICSKIVENTDEAVIAIDKDYNIILFNSYAEKLFEYSAREALGSQFNKLVPDRFHLQYNLVLSELPNSKSAIKLKNITSRDFYCAKKTGEEFLTDNSIIKIGSNSNPIYAIIIRDIEDSNSDNSNELKRGLLDPLTGAFSEKEFVIISEREVMRAKRYDRPLSLLLLQIDNSASIQDIHGGRAFDHILRAVMKSCEHTLRNVDVVGRWQAYGFGALLPETNLSNSKRTAERIKEDIDKVYIEFDSKKINFTASIGVAEYKINKGIGIDEQLENLSRLLSEEMQKNNDVIAF